MAIMTIDDYRKASKDEIQECFRNVTVKEDIDEYLNWLNKEGGKAKFIVSLEYASKRSFGVHPSSIKPGACPMKLYYECTGKVKKVSTIDPGLQRTFDLGTMMHCWVQSLLREMYGDQFKDEVWLRDDDLHITGRCDGIFTFSNVQFVLEIKSIKEGGNFGIDKVRRKPLIDNLWQDHLYMFCKNTPFVLFLYWCKNNSDIVEQPMAFNDAIWADIVETIKPVVDAAYNEGPMVKAKTGANCHRCDYLNGCKHGRSYISNARKEKSSRAKRQVRGIRM